MSDPVLENGCSEAEGVKGQSTDQLLGSECSEAEDVKGQSGDWRSRERRSPDRHLANVRSEAEGVQGQSPDQFLENGCSEAEDVKGQSGDWRSRGWHSRGYLPHYDGRSLVQHVTLHLGDSLPRAVIERIERSLAMVGEDQRSMERRKRLHEWIDAGHGRCVLREPSIAEMVQNTFLHFAGDRYQLHAWVVMPNHIHVLFEPMAGWTLAKIVASWKKFTARKIRDFLRTANGRANQEIGVPGKKTGPVWHSGIGTGIFVTNDITSKLWRISTTTRG